MANNINVGVPRYRVILSSSAIRDKEHHVQTYMTNNHINDKANIYCQININRDNMLGVGKLVWLD